jgi:8-oxo-dGTP pyrophosphatase MutT (NUDIX family)
MGVNMSKHGGLIETLARGVCVLDGHLLVCRTRGATNTYLPGGHVEFEESAPASLEREIEEEMGLVGRAGRFLGAGEHAFLQKGRRHCEVNLVYLLHVSELRADRPAPSREPHITIEWIPLAGLGESDLEPYVLRRLLPEWLDGVPGWGSTFGEPNEEPRMDVDGREETSKASS